MENRVNTKSSNYTANVKSEMLEHINNLKREKKIGVVVSYRNVIKHINSIKPIVFTKEDFVKENVVKIVLP